MPGVGPGASTILYPRVPPGFIPGVSPIVIPGVGDNVVPEALPGGTIVGTI